MLIVREILTKQWNLRQSSVWRDINETIKVKKILSARNILTKQYN